MLYSWLKFSLLLQHVQKDIMQKRPCEPFPNTLVFTHWWLSSHNLCSVLILFSTGISKRPQTMEEILDLVRYIPFYYQSMVQPPRLRGKSSCDLNLLHSYGSDPDCRTCTTISKTVPMSPRLATPLLGSLGLATPLLGSFSRFSTIGLLMTHNPGRRYFRVFVSSTMPRTTRRLSAIVMQRSPLCSQR
jgi:hypothetical protein